MLVPTSKSLIISNSQNDQALNTIKIDFSRMSFIKETNNGFTQCKQCSALLTIEDKKHINTKIIDQRGKIQWKCRFCQTFNHNQRLNFVNSNFKYCLKENNNNKINPPIILFLIDISGSMSTSLYADLKTSKFKSSSYGQFSYNQNLPQDLKKIIFNSVMRKHQIQNLIQIQKKYNIKVNMQQNFDQISKLSFLFSIIEHHLNILKNKKIKNQYRIGFIFFNDSITILKGSKQKSIPKYIHIHDKQIESYPFKQQKIDFNNYDSLFSKGKQYQRYFGDSKLNNFDINKLSLQHLKTQGKTALGPALIFSLGIISQHNQGSKIILVTDSNPNYGILSKKRDKQYYKEILMQIQKHKINVGLFRLLNNEFDNMNQDQNFQQFIKSNKQNITNIQVSIFPSITQYIFDNAIKSLQNLIHKQSVGQSYKLKILNDNKKISLNKFKYDQLDYRNLRFISSQSKYWVQINLNNNQIIQNDMLFPIMTQLIIEYDDIYQKKRYLFMSYILQRIIRPSPKPNQQSLLQSSSHQFLEEINPSNMQTIFDLENIKKFEIFKQSENFKNRTYRKQLNDIIIKINNMKFTSIQCISINDYTNLKNKVIEDTHSNSSNSVNNSIQKSLQKGVQTSSQQFISL